MIAFDSPEGTLLRSLSPSVDAVVSLWFSALSEGQEEWASWAGNQIQAGPEPDETIAALRFLQASADGDAKLARQLWAVLASFPIDDSESRIIQAARGIGQSLLK